jgi:hypothetical protein
MVIEACLVALLSGSVEYDGSKLDRLIDTNNKVVHLVNDRTLYFVGDAYSTLICAKKERFPEDSDDKQRLEMIGSF